MSITVVCFSASLSGVHLSRKGLRGPVFRPGLRGPVIQRHQHSFQQRQKCLPAVHFDLCPDTVLEVILGNIHNATTLFQIGTHVYLQANVCVVASAIPLLKTDYVQEPGQEPTTETCLD